MQGICIDVHTSAVLEEGATYYLFDHGVNNYYVSRFDNVQAQFGSYRKEMFQVTEIPENETEIAESVTETPKNERIKEKLKQQAESLAVNNFKPVRHIAKATKRVGGITFGKEYIIGPSKHMPYYDVYRLENPRVPIASYITLFFEIIRPFEEPDEPITETQLETAVLEPSTAIGEPVNTFVPEKPKRAHRHREAAKKRTAEIVAKTIKNSKLKKARTYFEKIELQGQTNIFEFMEG
ncbi:hypothetical protein Sam112_gp35 [Bacillus phage vB_BcM_Sam112]|uniref:Uncharacterized protein n=1 Tax=Bacillus phage vB_BcM_Sam112 TaxID=2663324 RepID=A0A5Q2F780_9CAUD|nr:hypothetical protein Sam112_gp35 [Bacillus phage vB_BcM_Sam112]